MTEHGRLLEGVYIPLITPFAADGSVALDAVERLCHEYLEAGSAGIVALGTTGEFKRYLVLFRMEQKRKRNLMKILDENGL